MEFDEIFAQYYTLYRGEAETPASSDDEYTIAMSLANEAVRRWSNYDSTYWRELFTTLGQADSGTSTISTGVTSYATPTDFKEAGGYVTLTDSDGVLRSTLKIVDPHEVQFYDKNAEFCYFTGNPSTGYFLNFNKAPEASQNGYTINYDYYKLPTLFETGSDITEMSEPYFIVHRMLANRFRASRNPYYNSALRDAEDALKMMQMDNNSGTWTNPWTLPDRSGTSWGLGG